MWPRSRVSQGACWVFVSSKRMDRSWFRAETRCVWANRFDYREGAIMRIRSLLMLAAALPVFGHSGMSFAEEFNIPSGDLKSALSAYAAQTGKSLIYAPNAVRGIETKGV